MRKKLKVSLGRADLPIMLIKKIGGLIVKIFVKRDRLKTYQEGRIVLESADERITLRMALSAAIVQCIQSLEKVTDEEVVKHYKEMLDRYQKAYDDLDVYNEIRE